MPILDSQNVGDLQVDVAIIGAGAAGCAAAAALAEGGYDVALIDLHARCANEFRAEKVGRRQLDYLDSFGLGEAARRVMTPYDGVWVHRYGRVSREVKREYGTAYGSFVNALRDGLPASVNFIIGRIETLNTSGDLQEVAFSDGGRVSARLLVLATGLVDVARRKLGIEKRVVSAGHSLTFGFDIAGSAGDFPFASMVWYMDRPREKGAYLALFPLGETLRANLFTYRDMSDPWVKAFRQDPTAGLHTLLPGLERQYGRIAVEGPVAARPIDLVDTTNHHQPGVVLIGDAFATSCPTTGTGLSKAFCDVDRLVGYYVPQWLATPGMAAEKIANFYTDPEKSQNDAMARRVSLSARTMRMDRGALGLSQRVKHRVLTQGRSYWRGLVRRGSDTPRAA